MKLKNLETELSNQIDEDFYTSYDMELFIERNRKRDYGVWTKIKNFFISTYSRLAA